MSVDTAIKGPFVHHNGRQFLRTGKWASVVPDRWYLNSMGVPSLGRYGFPDEREILELIQSVKTSGTIFDGHYACGEFERTGELRLPRRGEYYIDSDGEVLCACDDHTAEQGSPFEILRPIQPAPVEVPETALSEVAAEMPSAGSVRVDGVTLPASRKKCPVCVGSGMEFRGGSFEFCDVCHGEGEITNPALPNEVRARVEGHIPTGSTLSVEIPKLSDECRRLDRFFSDALTILSGAVPTPAKGYAKEGGLTMLLGDIRSLRRKRDELRGHRDELQAKLAAIDKAKVTGPMTFAGMVEGIKLAIASSKWKHCMFSAHPLYEYEMTGSEKVTWNLTVYPVNCDFEDIDIVAPTPERAITELVESLRAADVPDIADALAAAGEMPEMAVQS